MGFLVRISYKRKGLQCVIDRYGAYITHLISLTGDSSVKAEDRECFKGYLRKWRQPTILVGCAMHVEALKPVSFLRAYIALQGEGTNIVLSMENTLKSIKSLKSLSQQSSQERPMVKLVKSKL